MTSSMSKNDKNILQMILNPNLPLDEYDEEPNNQQQEEADSDSTYDQSKIKEVKALEKEGVKYAEVAQFDDAFKCFEQAIAILPERPSAYNNRAQCKRLDGNIDGAMEDLNKAISLSKETGKVAGLAYVQRALILKLKGEKQAAESDLKKAAELGNKFAKQELIQMNPYAALCNKMLSQVIENLQKVKTDQQ